MLDAGVIKAHAVDEGAVRGEAEEAGGLVSGLGFGGEGADFDVAEAEGAEGIDGVAFLIETGGETDGIGESETGEGDGLGLGGCGQRLEEAELFAGAQGSEGKVMGALGIKAEKGGSGDGVKEVEHDLGGRTIRIFEGGGILD